MIGAFNQAKAQKIKDQNISDEEIKDHPQFGALGQWHQAGILQSAELLSARKHQRHGAVEAQRELV